MARSPHTRPTGDLDDVIVKLVRRLEAVERRSSYRIGDWTLRQNQQGQLIAVNRRTGVTRVVALP